MHRKNRCVGGVKVEQKVNLIYLKEEGEGGFLVSCSVKAEEGLSSYSHCMVCVEVDEIVDGE